MTRLYLLELMLNECPTIYAYSTAAVLREFCCTLQEKLNATSRKKIIVSDLNAVMGGFQISG